MKTDLDGKLPKWVIWILVGYLYTVITIFVIGVMALGAIHLTAAGLILGMDKGYTRVGIILAILVSTLLVDHILFGSQRTRQYKD